MDKGYGIPTITNDGVTIAREIELKDPIENLGAQIVKEVATKSNDVAGDGTTTATVLAQALIKEGLKMVASGANPVFIRKGMEKASKKVIEELLKRAKKIESNSEIAQVGAISAGDIEIGELIAQAMEKVGESGVITVEEAKSLDTALEVVEGMQWDGYSYYDEGHLPWDFEHVDRIEAITNVLESEGGMGNEEVTLASSCGDGRHR